MPRRAPRWAAVAAIALLALAVLAMHSASATAEHSASVQAHDLQGPTLDGHQGDCHGCAPTHHLVAVCVAVIAAAVVWRAAQVRGERQRLRGAAAPLRCFASEAMRMAALPYQPDPPWVRLAVILR
jgi:hypothetical protein